ncbi:MAG: cytochrome P450 [Actinobacteria bacterium]|nr:MAG: cytochrome P450 [Actinomycetota bacterium]
MAEAPRLAMSRLEAVRLLRRDPIGLLERAADLGDVVRVRVPRLDLFVINHPDLVWDVLATDSRAFSKGPTMQAAKRVLGESLLTSEGEYHRRQRRLIQPLFRNERIVGFAPTIRELGERAGNRWVDREVIDVREEMARLTLGIVARTLFGSGIDEAETVRIAGALTDVLDQFDRVFSPLLPITERLPIPSTRRFRRAREVFDETVYGLIAERRASSADGDDLLSRLIRAQDLGPGMTDQQVRDEAVTIFLAGHETTSNALTWTWLLLSEHPDVEARFHERLDDEAFVRAALHEAMRLYPPAWAIGRRALSEHVADGVRIPAGAVVIVSPWLLHHDPRWWADPVSFRPERWIDDGEAARRHAYLPFGGGPRMCIGEGFAELEASVLLSTIGRTWRFEHDPAHRVELQPVVTLRPRNGMPMRAHCAPRGTSDPLDPKDPPGSETLSEHVPRPTSDGR